MILKNKNKTGASFPTHQTKTWNSYQILLLLLLLLLLLQLLLLLLLLLILLILPLLRLLLLMLLLLLLLWLRSHVGSSHFGLKQIKRWWSPVGVDFTALSCQGSAQLARSASGLIVPSFVPAQAWQRTRCSTRTAACSAAAAVLPTTLSTLGA